MIDRIRIGTAGGTRPPTWQPFGLYDPDAEEGNGRLQAPAGEVEDGAIHIHLTKSQYDELRTRMRERNPHCTYCGQLVTKKSSSIDHVLPRSRGGGNWPANLVLSCCDCNSMKSDMTLPEFREDVDRQIAEAEQKLAYLASIRPRVDRMLEDEADCYQPVQRAESTTSATRKPSDKKQLKRHDFNPGRRSYMVLRRHTGELLLRDVTLPMAVDFLLTDGADPQNPCRLLGYQELFNPEFNVPDWRSATEQQPGEVTA